MEITVIIPTFNRPQGLGKAVESVLAQRRLPAEIIIINDGRDYPELHRINSHPLVEVYHNEQPMGANYSRNKGAGLAMGDILMFLDDDDAWLPTKIDKQLAVFDKDPSIGLVYSNRNVVNEEGELIRKINSQKSGRLYPDILFENIIGTTSSVAVRKEVFQKAGGFDEQLEALQDFDLWIRICEKHLVGLDEDFSVNYTVAADKSGQISGSGPKKERAVKYILNKYHHQFTKLSFVQRQRAKSTYFFYISKSYKNQSLTGLLKYSLLSFFNFPNVKAIALILPDRIVNELIK